MLQECGYETIMINCNPETVSTDFDTADKRWTRFLGTYLWYYQHEKPEGVMYSLVDKRL
jgi:carbamoyl-phosphate synthase large subunit